MVVTGTELCRMTHTFASTGKWNVMHTVFQFQEPTIKSFELGMPAKKGLSKREQEEIKKKVNRS